MLTQHSLPPLSHVEVRTSGIIPAPISDVWKTVRSFGTVADWSAPIGMERITSILLPGSMEGQLGALRRVCFGELGFVEQLDALDDEKRLLKWRVISHPLNTNPFPGSFLNYRGRLRLRDVTINGLTLVELEGAFDTEHTNTEVMRRELKARQEANVRGLLALLTAKPNLSTQQRAAAVHPLMGSLPLPEGYYMQNASFPSASVPIASMGGLNVPGQGGFILPNGQMALVPQMANLGFNQASHPMPMGGGAVQSSPFINSGGPYSGQGIPLHASAHMAPPQAYAAQGGVPTSVHPQLLAQLSAASGGFMQPQMVTQPGPGALQPGMLPEQITSYNSINSFNSQDSMGSARGSAMSKAFQKAQQQVQSGMLSEAQLARLRIQLQQQGITLPDAPRVSSEAVHMGVPGMPDMPLRDQMHTSGDSHASLPTSHISPRTVGGAAAAALHKVPLVPDLAIAPQLNPSVGV